MNTQDFDPQGTINELIQILDVLGNIGRRVNELTRQVNNNITQIKSMNSSPAAPTLQEMVQRASEILPNPSVPNVSEQQMIPNPFRSQQFPSTQNTFIAPKIQQKCLEGYEVCERNPDTCVYSSLDQELKDEVCDVTQNNALEGGLVIHSPDPVYVINNHGRFRVREQRQNFPVAHGSGRTSPINYDF